MSKDILQIKLHSVNKSMRRSAHKGLPLFVRAIEALEAGQRASEKAGKEKDMTDTKISWCPFCGHVAVAVKVGIRYSVGCNNDCCACGPCTQSQTTKKKAIEIWNRRRWSKRKSKRL